MHHAIPTVERWPTRPLLPMRLDVAHSHQQLHGHAPSGCGRIEATLDGRFPERVALRLPMSFGLSARDAKQADHGDEREQIAPGICGGAPALYLRPAAIVQG